MTLTFLQIAAPISKLLLFALFAAASYFLVKHCNIPEVKDEDTQMLIPLAVTGKSLVILSIIPVVCMIIVFFLIVNLTKRDTGFIVKREERKNV